MIKRILKNYWIVLITVLVLFFWIGFFITENIYNQANTYYFINFESETIKEEDITKEFFLDALKKTDAEGNITGYSYQTVSPSLIFENKDITIVKENNLFKIKIIARHFIGGEEKSLSSSSFERFEKVMNKVLSYHDKNVEIKSKGMTDYVNPFIVGLYATIGGFIVFFVVVFLLRNRLHIPDDNIYETEEIFRHPFKKKFWDYSIKSFKNLKIFDMCLISILFALQILLKFVNIQTGFANLSIGITYLVFGYICLAYGPIWGVVIGFSSDIIGFILKPTIFHPGYTLQAMLTGFVYGLFLYRTDLRFSKVLLCRIIVNILLNGVFGAFLWGSYAELSAESTIVYMAAVTLPKNIIFLIPQTILMYLFLRFATPLLIRKDIVPKGVIQLRNNKPNSL